MYEIKSANKDVYGCEIALNKRGVTTSFVGLSSTKDYLGEFVSFTEYLKGVI